mmetsp:Transcript_116997/g.327380  ORF Transcript_116997/g.327380 Transcript_116997/m.327380 type:complete len:221 (+) Transcript_116997:659-1321(+)
MTTRFRGIKGAMVARTFCTLWLSKSCSPKAKSGLSLQDFLCKCPFPPFLQPLFSAHSRSARSLSSTKPLFLAKNWSNQSKVPSSGKPMGTKTWCFPSFGVAAAFFTVTLDAAASCNIKHLKGSGLKGLGPKLTCRTTFLYVTAGYKALPFMLSGNGFGSVTRLPSQNKLMVLLFGPAASKFSSTATTCPWRKPFPRPSKKKFSTPFKRSEDSSVAKPTRK